MTLKEIARPALLVAPDGWVALTTKPEDIEAWNKGAVKRYSNMGIEVFSADNRLWKFDGFDVIKSPTFFDSLRSWSMGLPPISIVNIHLREEEGNALERLLNAISTILEKDCDVLTQFKTKEEIIHGLKGTESVSDAIKKLRRLRVVRQ
jgi:hypothetical protein